MRIEYVDIEIAGKAQLEKQLRALNKGTLECCNRVFVDRLVIAVDIDAAIRQLINEESAKIRDERFTYIDNAVTGGKTIPLYSKNEKMHYAIVLHGDLARKIEKLEYVYVHELLHLVVDNVFIETRGLQAFQQHIGELTYEDSDKTYWGWETYGEYFVGRTTNSLGQVFSTDQSWYIDAADGVLEAIRNGRVLSQAGKQEEVEKALSWAFRDLSDRFIIAATDNDLSIVEALLSHKELNLIFNDGWRQLNDHFRKLFEKGLNKVSDEDVLEVAAIYKMLFERLANFCVNGQY